MMCHPGDNAGDGSPRAADRPASAATGSRWGRMALGAAGLIVLVVAVGLFLRTRAGAESSTAAPAQTPAGRAAPPAGVKPPKPVNPPVVEADTGSAPAGARIDSAAAAMAGASAASAKPRRLLAFYFRTTNRCPSCIKLENWSREAIEKAFPEQLKSGRVVWQMINVEDKGNEHFVKDYQLFTKSVVLVDEVQGKQARWKNLDKVWELLGDKEEFQQYVTAETRTYLETTP